jgi:hypothetical protein
MNIRKNQDIQDLDRSPPFAHMKILPCPDYQSEGTGNSDHQRRKEPKQGRK